MLKIYFFTNLFVYLHFIVTFLFHQITSLSIFNDLNWGSSSRAYMITSENLKRLNKKLISLRKFVMPIFGKMVITSFVVVILGLQLSDQVIGHNVRLVVLLLIVPAVKKSNWSQHVRKLSLESSTCFLFHWTLQLNREHFHGINFERGLLNSGPYKFYLTIINIVTIASFVIDRHCHFCHICQLWLVTTCLLLPQWVASHDVPRETLPLPIHLSEHIKVHSAPCVSHAFWNQR